MRHPASLKGVISLASEKTAIPSSLLWTTLHSGQFRDKKSLDLHEKSLDLSNYEIFPHKILKSRTFKKSILIVNKISTLKTTLDK
jgi:hypothetical protein